MAPVATYFTINESTNSTTSNSSSTIHVKAMDTIHYTLYYGTFIHTPELNELKLILIPLLVLILKVLLISLKRISSK